MPAPTRPALTPSQLTNKRPQSLLLRFFRVQELLAREQRRERPEWLRLMRLKRLALVLRTRLEQATPRGLLLEPARAVVAR